MRKIILSAFILFALSSISIAQEPKWLINLKQIELLKSTEKDVEKILGKPTDSFGNYRQYELEEGRVSVEYSNGKCRSNENSEFDVEKGTVVEIDFITSKDIKFDSLGLNLVGFKKEYSTDADGAYSYKNKKLGIHYSIGSNWLTAVSLTPGESYVYLACPKKPKTPEPVIDDVGQDFFTKLLQLKILQHTQGDVAAIFGKPFESKENWDFYMDQKYSFGFMYSTGKCSSLYGDVWNVSEGKITEIVVHFNSKGNAINLDLGKLSKKEDYKGFSVYENEQENIEYQIKDGRIWRIAYYPSTKSAEIKCGK